MSEVNIEMPTVPANPESGTVPIDQPIEEPKVEVLPDPSIGSAEAPAVNQNESSAVVLTQEPIETQAKHAGGRPCEYCHRKDEINKIATDYLELARQAKRDKKVFIPYLQELADLLDCDSDRVSLWANKRLKDTVGEDENSLEHPEFNGIVKKLNNLKELLLLQRTLGRFNPTGAIFQLKTKHGYIETEKKLLAGDTTDPLKIIVVEEKKLDEPTG